MLTVLTNSSVKAWIICSKHYYNAVLIFPHKHSSLMKNRLALFSEEDKVYLKLFVLLQRRGTSDYLKVIRASVLRQLAFWTRHRKLTPETVHSSFCERYSKPCYVFVFYQCWELAAFNFNLCTFVSFMYTVIECTSVMNIIGPAQLLYLLVWEVINSQLQSIQRSKEWRIRTEVIVCTEIHGRLVYKKWWHC